MPSFSEVRSNWPVACWNVRVEEEPIEWGRMPGRKLFETDIVHEDQQAAIG
jgi:hypothetical protein